MINTQASIKDYIQQNGWKRLLLAVSGGLDSICLAHFFICNKAALGLEWVGIAHVHHGLREESADRDAEFVKNFADKLNTPFFVKNLDGNALKKAEGSLEENARKARYSALQEFAEINNADAILTAHHSGDQAETMYMRLRRGVTLAGLSGMRITRPLQVCDKNCENAPVIYRPFLNVTRSELESYAKQNSLQWREDESNSDTRFTRNQIRHSLLPNLEKAAPEATQQLCRIAALAGPAYDKAMAAADKIFAPLVVPRSPLPQDVAEEPSEVADCTRVLVLDTRKAKVALSNGKDELFRLWLDKQGFRFPLETFKGKALLNDLKNLSFRSRFIVKKRHIIWICDKLTSACH